MKKNGVIIITGGGGGLGSAVAEVAHSAGYPVALVGRTKSRLTAIQKELDSARPGGAKVSIHPLDITDEKAVFQEFAAIKKIHGAPRALVNNAATWMGSTSVGKITAGDVKESFDLNFFSAFHATMATLKQTGEKPKNELAIINVGATASLDAWMEVLSFSLAKGALRNFSRALGRDLGPKGVHVAHLVIDGMLNNERTRKLNRELSDNRFINAKTVAEGILNVITQERSCWTMEWDVRPFNENW